MSDADKDMWRLVAQAADCLNMMIRDWDTSTIGEKRTMIDSAKDRILPVSEQLLVIDWMASGFKPCARQCSCTPTTPRCVFPS